MKAREEATRLAKRIKSAEKDLTERRHRVNEHATRVAKLQADLAAITDGMQQKCAARPIFQTGVICHMRRLISQAFTWWNADVWWTGYHCHGCCSELSIL